MAPQMNFDPADPALRAGLLADEAELETALGLIVLQNTPSHPPPGGMWEDESDPVSHLAAHP